MAFHPYPQLIRRLFNDGRFGPPAGLTQLSPWPWVDHPVSGLLHATSALFGLAFASAPASPALTSLRTATRRPVLQKVRRQALFALRLLVGIRFQVLFHSPPGVLFTFPSRYSSSIGRQRVFSLGGWSPLLPIGFLVPHGTQARTLQLRVISDTGLSPSMAEFPNSFSYYASLPGTWQCTHPYGLLPRIRNGCHLLHVCGLGSSPFARRYSGNLFLISSPPGTKMFQFPGFPPYTYVFSVR